MGGAPVAADDTGVPAEEGLCGVLDDALGASDARGALVARSDWWSGSV